MYGKHFEQMYEGSMVGAGAVVFAVMGYIIAKQKPSREHGSIVELNPKLLAYILGTTPEEVDSAVEKLCSPDPDSRTPNEDGRRLVRMGQFAYRVVNGAKYRAVRNQEERNEQVKLAMRRHRAKKNSPAANVPGEKAYLEAERNGATEAQLDQIVTEHLPPQRDQEMPVSEQPSSNRPAPIEELE